MPRDSITSCCKYRENSSSRSLYGSSTMSFFPCPPVAEYHARASRAAGLRFVSRTRVAASIRLAPASISRMSMPCSAAGRRPTADSSLVRPPTQSHMGNRARKPSADGVLVQVAALARDGDRVLAERKAQALVLGLCLEHAVARLFRAAALGDDHGERLAKSVADGVENAVDAVGVGVVEEEGLHAVAG